MKLFVLTLAAPLVFATAVAAEDKKKEPSPVTLTLVAKTEKYAFDGGGQTPDEYKKGLTATAKALDKGERVAPPKALPVDLVLRLTNTSKEEVTVYVGGDTNIYTFDLSGGAGVIAMKGATAFTAEFRLPKAVKLAPTKSHDIEVKQLSDGVRGVARLVFWTGPGEYTLVVKYTLADKDGGKGAALISEPVKITVEK